ncbi:BREX-1 system adenine-specific DNA-methyltransferase PglX [Pseudomonas aeruginosa]|uniref:BREX-1 system adenine-specific DNA-methyltransferase PglX n=1 Tax=Pseudomonas aeruginosa TaxID=287 RepID=UPI000F523EBC|nr:BREX-1 system adenine-specific DNA-methyltransferase PglX [Pseudomonas aeruginosa]RTS84265.1 BREX-1 system adenine-specific DNA-methyltransferase PglX [Pseudomonas aeruginosa]RUD41602.1 BREX-1 system adenine-specific DNA-methyltransferase PglX [Pseudomonas aeruginosa]RUD68360.1 BREX-1 system adenine-specific DNA-methyltransferase PglX [Pseudomonas aeruginosa]RUE10149.1 BREX-1 system adenine-specific DNA-methyltransferase PglX [Pseudomonas aeruginosa]
MSQEQNKDMSQYFYRASAADFMKIPGSPINYWLSENILDGFKKGKAISTIGKVLVGLQTGDNDRFIRLWHEVSFLKARINRDNASWVPYVKGGEFRKWYGNRDFLLDWSDDGAQIISHPSARPQNRENYFRRGITYTNISNGSFSARYIDDRGIFDQKGSMVFVDDENDLLEVLGLLLSKVGDTYLKILCPTIDFNPGSVSKTPILLGKVKEIYNRVSRLINNAKLDWDSYEISWDLSDLPLLKLDYRQPDLKATYQKLRDHWQQITQEMLGLEEENNRLFIDAYGLQDELTPDVPLEEITLTCNPHYRYGNNKSEAELETLLQCDTLRELVSYAIGCMMGRYSLDKPGLILASQGETLQDYLRQIPAPRFAPDNDAILPLTDQEWFADDATNRFREFIRVVWGDEQLQQNLDFVAESLCLQAIKLKKGESSLDTIRRYLSTQFFKDHLRTYKKRPIYWVFSSGKHKAFECLVYLHRYNEGTLARMRTEYVIPLTAKLSTYAAKLETDVEASTSTAEKKRLEKELTALHNQQAELATFDEKLRHYADQRISLDLDEGVKVNYGKFGDLLAEVKAVTGDKAE